MTVLEMARRYVAGGISVFPVTRNGVGGWKSPDSDLLPTRPDPADGRPRKSWNPFRESPPSDGDLVRWYGGQRPAGIAVVAGAVSGGLELLDFDKDAEATFAAWCALVNDADDGLLSKVAVVRTPRPGYHVWIRSEVRPTPPNRDIAAAPPEGDGKKRILIQTRGEGGYALAAGTPPECHETGRVYEHLDGPRLWDLRPLTADERDTLFSAARSLDRTPPAVVPKPKYSRPSPGQVRPGDDFDGRGDWAEILGPHGWRPWRVRGDEVQWTRPGKAKGVGATTGHCKDDKGNELLRVFTSSAPPLEAEKAYGKFNALVALNYGGDHSAAARALDAEGYGTRTPSKAKVVDLDGEVAEGPPPEGADGKPLQVATIADLKKAGAEVAWVWPHWIARGVLTAIAAEGGTGKTRLVADLMRRVRHGLPWPDGHAMAEAADAKALWVVSDNHHDEMVTLSDSFGITDSVFINAWASDPYGGVSLEHDDDFKALDLRCRLVKPLFVVVDTVGNATDRNLSKQEDARAFYQPLQVIARKHRCAVLCLTHLNATGQFLGRRVQEKVRVALKMSRPDPEQKNRRALEVHKSNSKKPDALGVTMGDAGNEYDHDPPKAPEGFEPGNGRPGPGRPAGNGAACIEWLRQRLSTGKAKVVELIDEAKKAGYETGPLYRARDTLDVVQSDTKPKWWSLPEGGESF